MLKLRTVKIAYWVFCASKHNRKFQILTFGEILTIWFSNLNRIRIRILFGFGKSCEYEYEYIRFWKIIRIRIRILFGLKISAEYEYEYHYSVSTIRILFENRIIRSPLFCNTGVVNPSKFLFPVHQRGYQNSRSSFLADWHAPTEGAASPANNL